MSLALIYREWGTVRVLLTVLEWQVPPLRLQPLSHLPKSHHPPPQPLNDNSQVLYSPHHPLSTGQ